jgi:hypothetical protein
MAPHTRSSGKGRMHTGRMLGVLRVATAGLLLCVGLSGCAGGQATGDGTSPVSASPDSAASLPGGTGEDAAGPGESSGSVSQSDGSTSPSGSGGPGPSGSGAAGSGSDGAGSGSDSGSTGNDQGTTTSPTVPQSDPTRPTTPSAVTTTTGPTPAPTPPINGPSGFACLVEVRLLGDQLREVVVTGPSTLTEVWVALTWDARRLAGAVPMASGAGSRVVPGIPDSATVIATVYSDASLTRTACTSS